MDVASTDTIDLSLMEPVFEDYREQPGALIPVLQKAQGLYGYLPPAILQLVAGRLEVPLSKVYGVATFYAQFYLERRGRHVLKLCDGTACHVRGAPRLRAAIQKEFGIGDGETTEDGELTLEIVYCMGSCALAPVAVLDNRVMGRMQEEKLLRVVRSKVASSDTSRVAERGTPDGKDD
jgi:NADH-quinone oxidoreductase subunit E